ncbi:hypothetical protein FGIG_12447 [Fasciola gigantica]|uniref:Uncharacterized protein n=1 Tax=Fasciola gigantica TaxID=46835 RepID=A0A504YVF2_FASGI|nr:hypothetical protein FGIG_12447 [Fasciola gigantica]
MVLRRIVSQRLSVGHEPLKHKECYDLVCQFFDLFLYQTGQFPDFMLMRKAQSADCAPEYSALRSSKDVHSRKLAKFLDSLRRLRTEIRNLPPFVHYFLILLGNLPSHPKRAYIVDFSSAVCTSNDGFSVVLSFSSFFKAFFEDSVCQQSFTEMKPTRIYLYLLAPKSFQSTWFLPKPNFHLFDKCPVFVLQVLVDSCHSLIMDEKETDVTLSDVRQMLTTPPTNFMWYASPIILDGISA